MSPRDEKLDLLKSIPLFAGFGKRELGRLGMLTDFIDWPAGRVLMRQGESGAEMSSSFAVELKSSATGA